MFKEIIDGWQRLLKKEKKRENIKRENVRVDCFSFRSTRSKYHFENVICNFASNVNHIFAFTHHEGIRLMWLVRLIPRLGGAGLDGTGRTALSTRFWRGPEWNRIDRLHRILLNRLRIKLKCLSLITIFKMVILGREGNSFRKELISFSSVFSLFVSFSFSHSESSSFRHFFETIVLLSRT